MHARNFRLIQASLVMGLAFLVVPGPVARLQAEELPAVASQWQLRLVWLVDGLADEAAKVPPADLESVTRELSQFGLTNLTMAAQMVLPATASDSFQVSGSANVNVPHMLDFSGSIVATESDAARGEEADCLLRLQIAITAREAGEQMPWQVCQVRTTVLAPIGEAVVLAITPVQSKPSVFLLLVSPGVAIPTERGAAQDE